MRGVYHLKQGKKTICSKSLYNSIKGSFVICKSITVNVGKVIECAILEKQKNKYDEETNWKTK
jgi:hypothetical protein